MSPSNESGSGMSRYDALEECRRRWPESNLHNAYECIEEVDGKRVLQFHVICHNPFHAGRGATWREAFEAAK